MLQQLFVTAIQEWFACGSDDRVEIDSTRSQFQDDLRKIIEQQQAIGWRQMFDGRFDQEWEGHQEGYYSPQRSIGSSYRTVVADTLDQFHMVSVVFSVVYKKPGRPWCE